MADIVDIPVSDLLLDPGNPRLDSLESDQQRVALQLAAQQGERLVKLAEDIVEFGTDPTALVAVVAVGGDRKRYRVLEGNRRVLALKALETPSLVLPSLTPKDGRKLVKLSTAFADDPIDEIVCTLFKDEADADHWIEIRHTGQNQGRGLVEWGSDEQDRFSARHAGVRKPAGQVIDFVEKHGNLSNEAKTSPQKILTSLQRLLSSPEARAKLGIDVVQGEVIALNDQAAVAKSLTHVVEELKTGKITVPDLYTKEDRQAYAAKLPRSVVPTKKSRLPQAVSLAGLTAGTTTPASTQPKKKPKRSAPKQPPRETVIPKSASLNVTLPRINGIYNELLKLPTDQYANACAVLLRVFVELSVDHFIQTEKLSVKLRDSLGTRMKIVATKLEADGKIPTALAKAVGNVADGGSSPVAASTTTFNQYVHNQYTHPKPTELYAAWDELQPFMEQLWP